MQFKSEGIKRKTQYQRGGIEPIDFIMSNDLNFTEGSAIKYIYRAKFKGTPIEYYEYTYCSKDEIETVKQAEYDKAYPVFLIVKDAIENGQCK